jgi:4-amino-4-deoxy-L-arabinose transferase-like glycosyltransferase
MPSVRRDLLVVATVVTLLLVPFLGKPLNIDDPLFVWAARQIAHHPTDPYGFTGNWTGGSEPFCRFMQNPPGLCYYLAAAGRVLGWSDVALHAALVPVGVLAAVGTYLLSARFCRRPLLATALVVASPAFLVSATTVMCDVPLVCLWVWSVLLWDRASSADRPPRAAALLAGSAAASAAAVLTK